MKKYLALIIVLIWLFCIIMTLNNWDIFPTDLNCTAKKKMEQLEFSGTVLKKYYDYENHGIKTLIIINIETNKRWKLKLILEKSDFFIFVNLNDTISKMRQSTVIKNKSQKKEIQLLYDCNK